MKKKLSIYVFRHGRTIDNIHSRFSGWRDSKLTTSGIDDAKIVGLRLKGKKIDVAFHTSLTRTKQTLTEAIKGHKECKHIVIDNRMIERNYGKLSGQTHYEIVKKFGAEKYDHWHRSFNARVPEGENFSDVEKRVKLFIKDLLVFMRKYQVNVAISAHGNSIRLFRKIMEKKSSAEAVTWEIVYDKVFTYEIEA